MKIEVAFSKKTFYTLLGLFLLITAGIFVYSYNQQIPNPGHGADSILISVGGVEKSLQDAVDDGDLSGGGGSSNAPALETSGDQGRTVFTYTSCTQVPNGMQSLDLASVIGINDQELLRVKAVIVRFKCGEANVWAAGPTTPPTVSDRIMVCNAANNNNMISEVLIPVVPGVNPVTGGTSVRFYYQVQGTDCPSIAAFSTLRGYYHT